MPVGNALARVCKLPGVARNREAPNTSFGRNECIKISISRSQRGSLLICRFVYLSAVTYKSPFVFGLENFRFAKLGVKSLPASSQNIGQQNRENLESMENKF